MNEIKYLQQCSQNQAGNRLGKQIYNFDWALSYDSHTNLAYFITGNQI